MRGRGSMGIGTLVVLLFFTMVTGRASLNEFRHWRWEGEWAARGTAGFGHVVRSEYYKDCAQRYGCTDRVHLVVEVIQPEARDGKVTRVFSGVAVSDLHWIEQDETLEVYLDPRPPWNFVLRTDHTAVPWKALALSALFLLLLVGLLRGSRDLLKTRSHRPDGPSLPRWVRRPRAEGTPWA